MAQHTVCPQSPGLIIKCNEIKINNVIKIVSSLFTKSVHLLPYVHRRWLRERRNNTQLLPMYRPTILQ